MSRRHTGAVHIVACLLALASMAWPCWASADPATARLQRVCLQVAMADGAVFESVTAELDRLGEQHSLVLADDGSVPSDVAWDGVYTGCITAPWARIMGVRLLVQPAGALEQVVYEGVEQTPDDRSALLAWRTGSWSEGEFAAGRVASAWPGNQLSPVESLRVVGSIGWAFLLVSYVFFLVHVRRQDRR